MNLMYSETLKPVLSCGLEPLFICHTDSSAQGGPWAKFRHKGATWTKRKKVL